MHEVRKNRFLDCGHLGSAGPYATLFHVGHDWASEPSRVNTSPILFWFSGCGVGLADRIFPDCPGPVALPADDRPVRDRETDIRRRRYSAVLATAYNPGGSELRVAGRDSGG